MAKRAETKAQQAKKIKAPYPVASTMGGTIRPMMKLKSQLLTVLHATPLARRLEGKSSEGMDQGMGPQERPKTTM